MPKKLFAVTNLKFNADPDDFINAGDEVDPEKFDKKTLIELHDAGAIEVRVVDDEVKGKERPGPLDDPDNEVVDDTAAGRVKTAEEEAQAKKDAIDAELKATLEAQKAAEDAAKKTETEEEKAARLAEEKAAKAAGAAAAAAAPAPAKTTPAPATTKPEDKK